jgi:anti-sigma factor RsiW
MNRDELEFAISRFLDGDLPPEQRSELLDRLRTDPQAQRLFDEHRALQAAMASTALPAVRWDRLAQSIASAVAGEVGSSPAGTAPADDALELAILQDLDGELPDEQRGDLERRLAAEPAARRLLQQHRALDVILKHAWPLPHVDYDRLQELISRSIADSAVGWRYSIPWLLSRAVPIAAAAVLLIGIGVAFFASLNRPGSEGQARVIRVVAESQVQAPLAAVREDAIVIGPSEDLIESSVARYADYGVVARPPGIVRLTAHTVPARDEGLFR